MLESRPQAGRLRLWRLPPAPRQARRQLLGNRLPSPPAGGNPATTAWTRATSSSCWCYACRLCWSAPCAAWPARIAACSRSRTCRGRRQAALEKGLRSVPCQLAKRLAWQDTARTFGNAWDTMHRAAGMAVDWNRARIGLNGVKALGVDEVAGRSASATSPPCINWMPVGGCCGSARSARSRTSRASSSGSPPSAQARPCTCSIDSMSPAISADDR